MGLDTDVVDRLWAALDLLSVLVDVGVCVDKLINCSSSPLLSSCFISFSLVQLS